VLRSVLVVDDHAEYRISVRALLEADGFVVLGEAGTGAEAIRAVGRLSPDVVLLDVRLPDMDGIAVAESVARAARSTPGRVGVQPGRRGLWRPVDQCSGTGISCQDRR
jgi:DNA-binding NarL/FixJ family response regulator